MRVVLDTNVLVAGLLWLGPPHRILEMADQGALTLCVNEALLVELDQVLRRPKFRAVIARRQAPVDELIGSVISTVEIFESIALEPIEELRDKEDMLVFECAFASNADYIVSGDEDVLAIPNFNGIPVITPSEFLRRTGK